MSCHRTMTAEVISGRLEISEAPREFGLVFQKSG